MRTELVVATYENPRALMLSLASVARQEAAPGAVAIPTTARGRRRRRLSRPSPRRIRASRCGTSGTRTQAFAGTRSSTGRSPPPDREKPGFYSAAHLQLNHYYTRSEAELAAKIGRGPNLAAKRGE
jgi:hypothetical protein